MTHTRILYWTKGVGEKRQKHDHVFKSLVLKTRKEAERYLEWGSPGNALIAEAQGLSKYGVLEDWKVSKVKVLSDLALEALPQFQQIEAETEAFKQEARDARKQKKQFEKQLEEVKADTRDRLEKCGWGSLTDEEFSWFVAQGKKDFYFRPSAEDIKAQYAKDHAKQTKTPDKFEGFEELRSTNGWLDPYGKYYPVGGFAQHSAWASDYLRDQKIKDEDEIGGRYPYEILEDLGWLRVMDWGAATGIRFGYCKEPTHDQKETLQLFCALHKVPYTF